MSKPFTPSVFAGQYVLLDHVATGGMADIYVAAHRESRTFEQIHAIKKILPRYSKSRAFVDMLVAEAKICTLLQHPGIVRVYDLGVAAADFYIAMEYVFGRSLDELIFAHKGPIPAEIAVGIFCQFAPALDYAHSATDQSGRALCLIHRDITPGNLLLSYRGQLKLTDFGVATAVQANLAEKGTALGKLPYMSPEQIINKSLDQGADIYSAGVVLFEMLTGQRPFQAKSTIELQNVIAEQACPKVGVYQNNLDRRLDDIFQSLLAKKVSDRPNDLKAITRELVELYDPASNEEIEKFIKGIYSHEQQAATKDRILFHLGKAPELFKADKARKLKESYEHDLYDDEEQETTVFVSRNEEEATVFRQHIDVEAKKIDEHPPKDFEDDASDVEFISEISRVEEPQIEETIIEVKEPSGQQIIGKLNLVKQVEPIKEINLPQDEVEEEIEIEAANSLEPVELSEVEGLVKKDPNKVVAIDCRKYWPEKRKLQVIGLTLTGLIVFLLLGRFLTVSMDKATLPVTVKSFTKPQLHIYLVSEKPSTAAEERMVSQLSAPAKLKKKESIYEVERFFSREFKRYKKKSALGIDLNLYGPFFIEKPAPKKNPFLRGNYTYQYFENVLRENSVDLPLPNKEYTADLIIFVYIYRKSKENQYPLEYFGERRKNQGILFVPLDRDYLDFSLVNLAFEVVVTYGGSKKYDAYGKPHYPHGFAEPHKSPLYPQRFSELMGRGIPISPDQTKPVNLLTETQIGVATAFELGWLDGAAYQKYYAK